MTQDLSAPALIKLMHHYYPAGISIEDPRYKDSEESRRLSKMLKTAIADTSTWEHFVQRVEASFPGCAVSERPVHLLVPSYQCKVLLPERKQCDGMEENAVACMLSVLAPVYAIYATHKKNDGLESESWRRFPPLPLEFQSHEAKLAGLIESNFGFTRLPNHILFTPVPNLRIGMFGIRGARLLECLF